MDPIFVTSSVSCWIGFGLLCLAASGVGAYQKNITAESGQNITLTCRAPNIVEWSRADLGKQCVLMQRDGHLVSDLQHPSFKNRVDLQDRQMKDGDVSVILKNVTTADAGTYECRVVQRRTNRRKRALLKTAPISIIYLSVAPPPGPGGGTTEDGVSRGRPGLVPPGLLFLLLVAAPLIAGNLP